MRLVTALSLSQSFFLFILGEKLAPPLAGLPFPRLGLIFHVFHVLFFL